MDGFTQGSEANRFIMARNSLRKDKWLNSFSEAHIPHLEKKTRYF